MINAEKVTVEGRDWIKVSFRYNPAVVEVMGKVRGALFNPKTKLWAVPFENKKDFMEKMSGFLVIWNDESHVTGGGISENIISDKPIVDGYSANYDSEGKVINSTGFKVSPIAEYQVRGFNALVDRDFLILADEMGLGKTWMMANALEAKIKQGKAKHGVVIAKASLLYNWKEEIEKFTNLKAYIVEGSRYERDCIYEKCVRSNDWNVLIVSYETYRIDVANFQNIDTIKTLDFLVMDEAHKVSNPQSKIGTVIHNVPYRYRYILTGSPLPNTPLQSFNYFKLGGKLSMNWWEFRKHYAEFGGFGGKEVVGYKNMGELHKLFQENMLRRLKSDKLKELPDVVFRDIRIDMCPKQSKLYEAVKKSIMEELKDTALERIPSALAKLMRLQQVTDSPKLIGSEVESAKLVALEDLVEDLMEGGQKVIIFSKFRTMVEIMQDTYKQYNPAIIHGDISAMSRQAEVHRFQTDPNCRIFIGCSPACREGLTLTAASNVIFMDMEWNWASYSQAWSRAHRIGQKNAVTVHNIICKDTIDEHVYKVVRTKKAISETLLDMKVDKTNAMLAREFISSMLGEVVPGGREDD